MVKLEEKSPQKNCLERHFQYNHYEIIGGYSYSNDEKSCPEACRTLQHCFKHLKMVWPEAAEKKKKNDSPMIVIFCQYL